MMMTLGYAVACLSAINSGGWLAATPFPPPAYPSGQWTISQKADSLSYLTFSTGFSLVVYALFVSAGDIGNWRLGLFVTRGKNALFCD